MIASIIVAAVIAVLFGLAIRHLIKNGSCSSCGSGKSGNGGCGGCPYRGTHRTK